MRAATSALIAGVIWTSIGRPLGAASMTALLSRGGAGAGFAAGRADAAWTSPWTSIGRPYVDVRETLRPDTTAALVASCDSFTIGRFGVATGGAAAGGLRPVEKTITGPLAWSGGAPLGLGVSDCTEEG